MADEGRIECVEIRLRLIGLASDWERQLIHWLAMLVPKVARQYDAEAVPPMREMTVGPPDDWTAAQIADFQGRFDELRPVAGPVRYAGRGGPVGAELVLKSHPPEVLCKLASAWPDVEKTIADCKAYANPITFRGHPNIPIPEHTHVFRDGPGASVMCEHCPKVASRQRLAAIVQETQAALRGHDLPPECPCGIARADCTYHRAL